MGLFDKYIQKVAGSGPDITVLMARLLDPEDEYLSWTSATPEAFTRDSGGASLSWALISAVVDKALTAASTNKHIGGAQGSIATTLPTDGETLTLVASRSGLSVWRFMGGAQADPTLYYRMNAEHIRSVTDTGDRAQGGARIFRVTFSDDSFFDYRVLHNYDEFLSACQRFAS